MPLTASMSYPQGTHAFFVHWYSHEPGTRQAEDIVSSGVGGAFHQNGIAGLNEGPSHQIHGLLGTGGDEDFVICGRDPLTGQYLGNGDS